MKIKIKEQNKIVERIGELGELGELNKKMRIVKVERTLKNPFAFVDGEEVIIFITPETTTIEFEELTRKIYEKLGGLKNGNIQVKK